MDLFMQIIKPANILDIAIVAFVIYKLMLIIKGTRAVQLLRGFVFIIAFTIISDILNFELINWILKNIQTMLLVAIPIVFQPELRRALEKLGRGNFIPGSDYLGEEDRQKLVSEMLSAIKAMSRQKVGAIMVLEREIGLEEYVETGTALDSVVSGELLINLFVPKSPLHDGAVIIKGMRIVAAGCFLPLSENPNLSKELGTRHRASLGVTEVSDSVVVIVSEETGIISIAEEGKLIRYLDEITLRELLLDRLGAKRKKITHLKDMKFWTKK